MGTAAKVAGALASLVLLTAACSLSMNAKSAPSSAVPTGGTPIRGGTVTWAELPSDPPNFIYPFMPSSFFSAANISQFQYMMYRPLYWFGTGNQPTLNLSESLADAPSYSNGGKSVSITVKHVMWSNGEAVDATDVMNWMNMWHAEKVNWAAYVPNVGMPDDVTSVRVNNPSTLTVNLSGAVNPFWFTYNMLSQITPLPEAWDITHSGAASGSGGCGTGAYGTAATDAKCTSVWTYMNTVAGYNPKEPGGTNNSLATYATNPLWQVVDGPWHLTSFHPDGRAAFAPNASYSGPVQARISSFVELPFTDQSSELNSLVGGKLTMGYLPIGDVGKPSVSARVAGPNLPRLASNYYLVPFYSWSINYFPYNFNSTGDGGNAGKIFRQLYFRQAMQYLVDQPRIITEVDKGYGVPTYGPVPVEPANPFVSPQEKSNSYPYNRSKAIELLKSHGWKVVTRGIDSCIKPGFGTGACGAGIPAGAKLDFNLQYASGSIALSKRMSAEASSWASAGIKVNLSQASFDTVIRNATACIPGPSCTWELQNWGTGWIFAPDFYPTGEEFFSTGGVANYGSFSDATNDKNILATTYSGANLFAYEIYLAKQLPAIFQDNPASYIWEIDKKLRGVVPLNQLVNNDPERYYFVK